MKLTVTRNVPWRYQTMTNTYRDGPLTVRGIVPQHARTGRYVKRLWLARHFRWQEFRARQETQP